MKTDTLISDSPLHTPGSNQEAGSAFSSLGNAARALYSALNQMGTAIALGEAGDLDGAHAWREQHGAK